jgi:hypothetical protein
VVQPEVSAHAKALLAEKRIVYDLRHRLRHVLVQNRYRFIETLASSLLANFCTIRLPVDALPTQPNLEPTDLVGGDRGGPFAGNRPSKSCKPTVADCPG